MYVVYVDFDPGGRGMTQRGGRASSPPPHFFGAPLTPLSPWAFGGGTDRPQNPEGEGSRLRRIPTPAGYFLYRAL